MERVLFSLCLLPATPAQTIPDHPHLTCSGGFLCSQYRPPTPSPLPSNHLKRIEIRFHLFLAQMASVATLCLWDDTLSSHTNGLSFPGFADLFPILGLCTCSECFFRYSTRYFLHFLLPYMGLFPYP